MKHLYLALFFLVFCNQILFGGIVETFNLKNGIKVIYKKTDSVEIVSLKFYSPVSVLQENVKLAGVTSLLHDVMNKSTKNRNSDVLSTDIENLGSSISSDVEYDYSGFTLNCMSCYFDASCAILADIILNPALDEEELAKEKIIMKELLKSRTDSIGQTANDKFIADYYGPSHPYSYVKYGKAETLDLITKKDLQEAYEKIYSSKGIVITVVGNIKKSQLKSSLEKYFSTLKLADAKNEKTFDLYVNPAEKDVVEESKFNQAFVLYAYPAASVSNKDFATLKLINAVLGGRMTGRLFVELREKLGLAYEVNSIYPTRKDKSYFEIYLGLDKKNIDVAKKGIEKITEDLCSEKIGSEELQDTKNFIKGVYLLDHQAVERQAYYLAFREITGLGYEYDEKYIEELEKITSDDITAVANKYFKQRPYRLILSPVK